MLGPLEVCDQGRPVPLGGPKARAVLAMLLLHRNELVPADRIIEDLWHGKPPLSATSTLQTHVSHVRRAVGAADAGKEGSRLFSQATGYVLRVERGELDADLFERLAREGSEALARGAHRVALDRLQEALSLWRGPPLADLASEDFARPEITRLEESQIVALEDRIQAELALGRHSAVMGELEALVTANPLRERLHGHLMLSLYRSGRQADALHVYESLRNDLAEELGIDPSPDVRDLHLSILRQEPGLRAAEGGPGEIPNNLPFQLTSFIGRAGQLAQLKQALQEARLVTIAGAPGMGKTRVAIRLACEVLRDYPDGVWLVELASISDGTLVPQAVAAEVGTREATGRSVEKSLIMHLESCTALILLDNCEHLVDDCATLVEELLQRCPNLRIVATSREVLNVPGELAWRVPPLSLPDRQVTVLVGQLQGYEGVNLFVERARMSRAGFTLSQENAEAVVGICRRLDGIPLAIELAAARMSVMSPHELMDGLSDRFRLLTEGSRTAPARQQTLRATIDWSHDLLTEQERSVFRRLSVFIGRFRLEAAKAVCSGDDLNVGETLTVFTRLVAKSLVVVEESTTFGTHYRLLETIRQYARERLEDDEDSDAVHRRHALFYAELAEQAEGGLATGAQSAWLFRLDEELDNSRAALEWSLGVEPDLALRMSAALAAYWITRGFLTEGRKWLEAALGASSQRGRLRAKALAGAGLLASAQGDWGGGRSLLGESIRISRRLADRVTLATGLNYLGRLKVVEGQAIGEGMRHLHEALGLWRDLGDEPGIGFCLQNLGLGAYFQGEFVDAREFYVESLAIWQELDERSFRVRSLFNLGAIALETGDLAEARHRFEESLQLSRHLDDKWAIGFELECFSALAVEMGQPERCMRLAGAAASFRAKYGSIRPAPWREKVERWIAPARERLGERAEVLFFEGRSMTVDQAMDYSLETAALSER